MKQNHPVISGDAKKKELIGNDTIESVHVNRSCGVASLDAILSEIDSIDWESCQPVNRNGEIKPPNEKDYILHCIDRLLLTADVAGTPFVNHTGTIYYYTGTHYKQIDQWNDGNEWNEYLEQSFDSEDIPF